MPGILPVRPYIVPNLHCLFLDLTGLYIIPVLYVCPRRQSDLTNASKDVNSGWFRSAPPICMIAPDILT